METIEVFLDAFLPNPWQPRDGEDPEHIKKIALSIAKDGLMQIPVGRWVFPEGKPVTGMGRADLSANGMKIQLAFGHSRLAAFKWLRDEALSPEAGSGRRSGGDFTRMPVVIRELSDEEMFRLGVSENVQRRDLNPIEEARAMARYRDEFKKNSADIGDLFGLAESSVRNKMRLLKLPESIQNLLRSGDMTEGIGRALIPLYDIPEAVRLESEDSDDLKPSIVLEVARSGVSPDKVIELVGRLTAKLNNRNYPLQLPIVAPEPKVEAQAVNPIPEADEDETEDNEEGEESDAQPASVSMETLVDEAEEDEPHNGPAGEVMKMPEEPARVFAEVKAPAPRPIPSAIQPKPAAIPMAKPVQAQQPAASAPVKPQPAPVTPPPSPPPAKPATVPWEKSTILLSLTLWPDDGQPGGRMVSMGARANQGIPMMGQARMNDLALPGPLQEMLSKLHQQALDAIPAEE